MPFVSFKESKERKLLKKVIQSKDTTPAENLVVQLIRMMDDEMNRRVITHNMIKSLEKGLEEKKYIRLLCLFYRLMDVDVNSFILNQLSIKDNMVLNSIPKGASKNTQLFAKHFQLKVNLWNNFHVLVSAENDAQDVVDAESREEVFGTLELLNEIAKNIEEFSFNTTAIQFHVSDILLLELTITFFKINCYASSLANGMLKMGPEESTRLIEVFKTVDRIRHRYFQILQSKVVKESFSELPSLSFMPTGPLQTFIQKRADKIAKGESPAKMEKEIETFNMTFQSDIAANDVKIKQFICRPLISINDGEDSRESLSRSISRSASSMDPTTATSVGSFGGSTIETHARKRGDSIMISQASKKAITPRGDVSVAKPVAKRAGKSRKGSVQRPSTSFVFLDESDDEL